MKKIIVLLCLLITSTANAAVLPIGTFQDKGYSLKTESLRFCSTSSCLYVGGKPEQSYIAAEILVAPSMPPKTSGDVLSYNKETAFEIKTILISPIEHRFVLLYTMTYDTNGNLINAQDETVEIKTIKTDGYAVNTKPGEGEVIEHKEKTVTSRRIAWSNIFPGTPAEIIVTAVLNYAAANYAEIDAVSRTYNYIKTE